MPARDHAAEFLPTPRHDPAVRDPGQWWVGGVGLLAAGLGGWPAQAAAAGRTWQAIAQAKAAISRAIAVATRFAFLPAATRRRWRAHSRSRAFQATARAASGTPSSRARSSPVTRAGKRWLQAPSTGTRRARPLPASVIPPRSTLAPLEC